MSNLSMMNSLNKPFIFITGAPRSGTSLLTKIIDSHPDIAILMENIFGNRRRHWMRENFWNSPATLKSEVEKVYARLNEPVVGNKVITPDVWDTDDVLRFCRLFKSFKIIFVVRDPKDVALSRLKREPSDFFRVFTQEARENILLDFRSRSHAYISSWRQSIEAYWKLRDGFKENVRLVYYDDLCLDVETCCRDIFSFLNIPFSDFLLRWNKIPHHDAQGRLLHDLKYPDVEIFPPSKYGACPDELPEALTSIEWQYKLWKQRRL